MRTISGIMLMLMLLLVSTLSVAFNIRQVRSDWTWTETIYIRADGSIYPATAPIISTDNVTYTLTDNIIGNVSEGSSAIIIERDNITIDGAGHAVQSTALTVSSHVRSNGIYLFGTRNVTVKDININVFWFGIYLNQTSHNSIFGNNITKSGLPVSPAYAATQGNGIYLESCSGNTISGNNITNSNYGIHLESSSNNTISGNNITNNGYDGIWLESSSNNTISGNNITNNGDSGTYDNLCGISLSSSSNYNSVSGNNITRNALGIDLSSSSYNSISDNNIANNWPDIYHVSIVCGIYLDSSSNNSISGNEFINNGLYLHISDNNSVENNTVNGRPLVYLEDESNRTVDDAGQVILVRCENIRVEGLNLSRTTVGVELSETNNSTISGNNITNNYYGIYLDSSSYNSISDNNITNNLNDIYHVFYVCGIYLDSSSNNTISGNNITNNEENIHLVSNLCGIYLDSSSNNSIFHNNFVNNTVQFFSRNSTNIWDDGYPSGGNYWSDYSDFDFYSGPYQNETGSDEIWDHPYVIDENNTDNYPMAPEFPSILILSPENRTYNVGNISLTFTVDRTVSWIGYGLDGQANMTVSGNATLTDLSEGLHRIAIYANDSAGDMGASNTEYFTIDMTPPTIGTPNQSPSSPVELGQEVKVSVNVTDASSGVKNVTLLYTITNGSSWENPTSMSYNVTTNLYETTVLGQPDGTVVKYKIVAYDNAGNERINDDLGEYYVYSVVPEFPSFLVLPSFVMATLLAVIIYGRKHAKKR